MAQRQRNSGAIRDAESRLNNGNPTFGDVTVTGTLTAAELGVPISFSTVVDGGGTLSINHNHYYRRKKLARCMGKVKLGTLSATPCAISLPSELLIDTDYVVANQRVGTLNRIALATGSIDIESNGWALYFNGTASDAGKVFVSNIAGGGTYTARNTNAIFASGDILTYDCEFPVVAWTPT